jgi:hypothetical protein
VVVPYSTEYVVGAPFELSVPSTVALFGVSGVAELVTAVGAVGAGCALAALTQAAAASSAARPAEIFSWSKPPPQEFRKL